MCNGFGHEFCHGFCTRFCLDYCNGFSNRFFIVFWTGFCNVCLEDTSLKIDLNSCGVSFSFFKIRSHSCVKDVEAGVFIFVLCSFWMLVFFIFLFPCQLFLRAGYLPRTRCALSVLCLSFVCVFFLIVGTKPTRRDESFLTGLPLFDKPGSSAMTFLRIFMSIPFMLDTEKKYGGRTVSW